MKIRTPKAWLAVGLLSLGACAALMAQPGSRNDAVAPTESDKQPANSDDAKVDPKAWDAIQQSAEKYVTAYNAGDAQAISKLYTEQAELVTTTGMVYRGRTTIAEEYAAFFKAHPEAMLKLSVESVRFITPELAVEDGIAESTSEKNAVPEFSRYVATHLKQGDSWLLASVRDGEVQTRAHDDLEELNWLIGQWVEESPESLMEIDCYWHPSGSYLMRDFKIKVEGLLASSGTERIGWDPQRKQIRSWLFDADGGYLEATWIRQDEQWIVNAQGFRGDGEPIHATYVSTSLRADAYHMTSINRTAGRESLEEFEMTIVRRPPAPGKLPKVEQPAEETPKQKKN